MRTKEALLESTDPRWIRVAGLVRRMAISLTSKVLWQLAGFRLPDTAGGATGQEVVNAEPFPGIGFFARPPSSGSPEAIVVLVGDANVPAIVAARDEKTRAAIAGGLALDETAIFNSQAMLLVRANGTIEVGAGASVEPTVKGSTYRSAEDRLVSALQTFVGAIGTYAAAIKATADPSGAATAELATAVTVVTTAIGAFRGGAASYLTTIAKVR